MSNLDEAFNDKPPYQLLSRVKHVYQMESLAPLLNDISNYVIDLHHEIRDLKRKLEDQHGATGDEPAAKKRKLPIGLSANAPSDTDAWFTTAKPTFTATEISFSIPMRKKLTFDIIAGDNESSGGIRVLSTDQNIAVAWTDVEQMICVPVPEKAQAAYQFVLIPRSSPTASHNAESIMWTIPSIHPKQNQVTTRDPNSGAESNVVNPDFTLDLLLLQTINTNLQRFQKAITLPSPNEFTSVLVQSHLKGQSDRAYHVKAFRGSKDGFLYFLPTGILYTPRKPLLFFPFSAITSISYSSVLQRTFNLNITARVSPSTGASASNGEEVEESEFEFAMLDQADHTGIDAYVKRHGLHDASLAESRRAKIFNVNPTRAADAATNGSADGTANGGDATGGESSVHANGIAPEDGEEESALAKAERELQDAEDAEEDDYDPSGGESEGSASESEEEEDVVQTGDIEEVEPQEEDDEEEDDEDGNGTDL